MDEIGEIGDGSVHYAESVRHVGGLGIEEIPGLFSEESVSMDHPWIRSAVMEMGAEGSGGSFLPPFQGSLDSGLYLEFHLRLHPGPKAPVATSRLLIQFRHDTNSVLR